MVRMKLPGVPIVALLLVSDPVSTASTDPWSEIGSCKTEFDCNHNGVCNTTTNTCVCDPGWSGNAVCSQLALLPVPPSRRNYTGGPAPLGEIFPGPNGGGLSVSSWGGSVMRGANGKYHLLVAEMEHHCGLVTWQHNSAIRHATADSVDGAYTPQELVMGIFSHNPSCLDASPAGGPQCVLLHVGTGTSTAEAANCSGGFTPKNWTPSVIHRVEDHTLAPGILMECPVLDEFNATSSVGSWRMENLTCAPDQANSTLCKVSNPTGWVRRNCL